MHLTRLRSEVGTREVERRRRAGVLGALGAIAQRRGPSLGRKPVATAAEFNSVRDEREARRVAGPEHIWEVALASGLVFGLAVAIVAMTLRGNPK